MGLGYVYVCALLKQRMISKVYILMRLIVHTLHPKWIPTTTHNIYDLFGISIYNNDNS